MPTDDKPTRRWDVFIDTFVNVTLPDDVDPNTEAGYRKLHEAAYAHYAALLKTPDYVAFSWEEYKE